MEKLDEGFFNQYTDDFLDYFETHKVWHMFDKHTFGSQANYWKNLKKSVKNDIIFMLISF